MDRKKTAIPGKKAKDKAGRGQSDEEKGIASGEERRKKQEKLLRENKARRRPQFNGQPNDGTGEENLVQPDPDT
ncbi:hypothetical protein [Taibaiella helva]|uniref:hypothetical protein n=1 Tax=Taibaiella helva TaxID=2301235 RepID=UPI000E56C9C6|nr:hypothetical protein [Taibaiella helva]